MIIRTIPTSPAIIAPRRAVSPSVALIFSSCLIRRGAGSAHSFNDSTRALADSPSNCQSICAVPAHILS